MLPQRLHPAPLAPGARVAIISPAGPVVPELMEPGLKMLKDWGLEVHVDPQTYRRHGHDYLAGDDTERLEALHRVMADPKIDAVLCSRGGYGCMRILPRLDATALAKNPKLLVGFSDITALHLHLAGNFGLCTLHGPVLKSFRHDDAHTRQSLADLRAALFGERPDGFMVEGLESVRPGQVRGRLLGGNLSLVASLLASPYCPDLSGCVLLVEDISEQDYRIDRLLTAVRLSEKARNLGGLVLGDFTECHGPYVPPERVPHYVCELAREFDCPVVAGFPSGHTTRNIAVPMGVDVLLDATRGRLTFLQDAVASLSA